MFVDWTLEVDTYGAQAVIQYGTWYHNAVRADTQSIQRTQGKSKAEGNETRYSARCERCQVAVGAKVRGSVNELISGGTAIAPFIKASCTKARPL